MALSNDVINTVFNTLSNNDMLFVDTDMYNIMSKILSNYKDDPRVKSIHANLLCVFKWNRNELSIIVCDQYQYIKDGLTNVLKDIANEIRNLNIKYVKRVHIGDGDEGTIYVDIDPNYFLHTIYNETSECMKGIKDEEVRITG